MPKQKKNQWNFILWLDNSRTEESIEKSLKSKFPEFEKNGIRKSNLPIDLLDGAFFTKRTKWIIKCRLSADRTFNQIRNRLKEIFPEAIDGYEEIYRSYPKKAWRIL